MKHTLKRLLPPRLLKILLHPYHWLRALAANIRYGFPARGMRVIGVTGTNGKTTTVNYIAEILQAAGHRVGVSTTANFRIGDEEWLNELNMTTTDPFQLQRLLRRMRNAEVDWVVLEVTSHALDQYRVWGVPFQIATITNLTPDHMDYHGTMDRYAACKARLLQRARQAVVLNHDDEWYEYFLQTPRHAVYSYGTNEDASVRVDRCQLSAQGAQARLRYGERVVHVDIALPGKFNVYNALAAAATAFGVEIPWQAVQTGLQRLQYVPGRMESVDAGQSFDVIIDYAHTPEAFQAVLSDIRTLTKGRVIAVFGGAPTHDYEALGRTAGANADVAVVTDDEPMQMDPEQLRQSVRTAAEEADHAEVVEVADREDAIAHAFSIAHPKDTVVLLGLGHQTCRRIGSTRMPWQERQVVEYLLEHRS